ncbi:MAG: hypothetical protein N2109_13140 [Fimbriimonadales bacterium]|nr:hypothetical protein [Fimbriimonadales bacterium]
MAEPLAPLNGVEPLGWAALPKVDRPPAPLAAEAVLVSLLANIV